MMNGYYRRLDALEGRIPQPAPASSPERIARIVNDPQLRALAIARNQARARHRFEDAERFQCELELKICGVDAPELISRIVNDSEARALWSEIRLAWKQRRREDAERLKRELARRIDQL